MQPSDDEYGLETPETRPIIPDGACPNCGEPASEGVVLCVACGLHFGSGKMLATKRVASLSEGDTHRPGELTTSEKRFDLFVRLLGFSFPVALVVAAFFGLPRLFDDSRPFSPNDYSLPLGILGFVLLLLFAIVGTAIGLHGAAFGPDAADARSKGVRYIWRGFAAMALALVFSVLVSLLLSALLGPAALIGVGVFACGVISVLVGLVGISTGHDLGDALRGLGEEQEEQDA